ncbi:tripartite tricarboxylate transporter substrate-binding protein (plasmid) [Haloferacaceae archaeon DSL9]
MVDKVTTGSADRRQFMKYTGSVSAAAMLGLAGCTSDGDGGDGGSGGDGEDGGDDYPSQDLRYIIPFSEGGGTDTFARQVIPQMADNLGVNIAIENISGAASLRGTGELYHSDSDGYTFGGFNPPSTPVSAMVNPPDYEMQELEGVGSYARTPFVIVANPEHEIEGFDDMMGRYESGELEVFGGKERGGVDHVLALLMQNLYDFQWDRYTGYDGSGPAVQATISNEIPCAISTDTAAQGAVEDGRLDTVVGLSSNGTEVFPDLESVTDLGYDNIDYLGELRRCMYAPPGTSSEHTQTLSDALEQALQSEEVQQWAEDTGNVIEYGDPESASNAVSDAFEQIPENVDLEEVREAAN